MLRWPVRIWLSTSFWSSFGITILSAFRTTPLSMLSSSLKFQKSVTSSGTSDFRWGHPFMMTSLRTCSLSSLIVAFLIFSNLLMLTCCTSCISTSMSGMAKSSWNDSALDNASAKMISLPGRHVISKSYIWSLNSIRCNLGRELAMFFFWIISRGLWSLSTTNFLPYR